MSEPAQVASMGVQKTKLFANLKQSFQAQVSSSGQASDPVVSAVVPAAKVQQVATEQLPTQPAAQPPQETPVAESPQPVVPPQPAQLTQTQEPSQAALDTVPSAPSVLDAVTPQIVEQEADTLNPPFPVGGGTAKELKQKGFSIEKTTVDTVPGMQYLEHEDNHELPPEVESFVKKVEDHQMQLPQEIVIADQISPTVTPQFVAQPVIVLPITPEMEKEGMKKDAFFSIRWLVEWSHKMMKMFSGRVIYRQEPAHTKA